MKRKTKLKTCWGRKDSTFLERLNFSISLPVYVWGHEGNRRFEYSIKDGAHFRCSFSVLQMCNKRTPAWNKRWNCVHRIWRYLRRRVRIFWRKFNRLRAPLRSPSAASTDCFLHTTSREPFRLQLCGGGEKVIRTSYVNISFGLLGPRICCTYRFNPLHRFGPIGARAS